MTNYKTNRPWLQSFDAAIKKSKRNGDDAVLIQSGSISISQSGLDQVHKLARNYIVSLDLGGPNMNVVEHVDLRHNTKNLNGKEKYLEWVRNWKIFYRELSELIRHYKKTDRNELFRLKETAQVMLNARYVGKLASWAIVQRTKRLNAT